MSDGIKSAKLTKIPYCECVSLKFLSLLQEDSSDELEIVIQSEKKPTSSSN